jgi:hypothetical protein
MKENRHSMYKIDLDNLGMVLQEIFKKNPFRGIFTSTFKFFVKVLQIILPLSMLLGSPSRQIIEFHPASALDFYHTLQPTGS